MLGDDYLGDDPDELDDVDQVDEDREREFPTLEVFVVDFLTGVYSRPVGPSYNSFYWCPMWWQHAEAIGRLNALWDAYELLRLDPDLGAAKWWRDFADPTMGALCHPEGPFSKCSTNHRVMSDLPTTPAPAGWFSADA